MARDRASRPEAKPLRLFVAMDVPEDARNLVESAVAPVRERHPRARWVPTRNQHVTVKFLGRTWPRLLGLVEDAVRSVASATPRFESKVSSLDAFPSARRARVLWAGLEDPEGRMTDVASQLDVALASEFEPERRGFTAHLTVARFDPPVQLEPEELAAFEVRSKPFVVDRLVLYRSHLRRPAPVYEPIAAYPLGGEGD